MDEKKLIRLLIFLGVFSLVAIVISQYITTKIILGITRDLGPLVVPLIFCQKTEDGSYFLASPANLKFCDKINDIKDLDKIDCKLFYERGTKEYRACQELVNVFEKRKSDCVNFLFLNISTSATNTDIDKQCSVLAEGG